MRQVLPFLLFLVLNFGGLAIGVATGYVHAM